MGRPTSWLSSFSLVLAIVFCSAASSFADDRVALVIGNGLYQKVPALPNPPRDATDIAGALQRLSFKVILLNNANASEMRKALVDFGRRADGSDIALVFYAGHGMEAGGENWLIPTDAELQSDTDVEAEAISLRSVSLQVGKAKLLGLVILDACRNNPFANKMKRSLGTRAVDRGLARTEPTENVLVAYAARDGTTALDGTGQNSPFTTALLKNIETPGLEVSFLFRRVRDDVMAATKKEQQPFVYGSLSKDEIYLKPALPIRSDPPSLQEEQSWRNVVNSDVANLYEEFVNQYPTSPHVEAAKARITRLSIQSPAAQKPMVDTSEPPSETRNIMSGADIARLSALSVELNLPLPDFKLILPNETTPVSLRRFVGVWANKRGYEGGGRTAMVILTEVDPDGTAFGRYFFGPPTNKSWVKNPSGSALFKGMIKDGTLQFQISGDLMKGELRGARSMEVTLQEGSKNAKGHFEAAWQLDRLNTLGDDAHRPSRPRNQSSRSHRDVSKHTHQSSDGAEQSVDMPKQVACGPGGCRDVPKGCHILSGSPGKNWSVSTDRQYVACN